MMIGNTNTLSQDEQSHDLDVPFGKVYDLYDQVDCPFYVLFFHADFSLVGFYNPSNDDGL
ncbi:hypothetical protein CON64_14530 [Bacillus pseudomycoides]|nr:hypothetical protein CON64_14530 [Bacillus pseudomycoides]